jgi:hypothetical protein
MQTFDKSATSEMLTHLCQELAQAVWLHLLDDDFVSVTALLGPGSNEGSRGASPKVGVWATLW